MQIGIKRWLLVGCGVALLTGRALGSDARSPAGLAREFEERVWTRELGLPDNRVRAICQTQDGYLWVGTSQGLTRFDGHEFVSFYHSNTPEFTSDSFQALAEDSAGRLWISSLKETVCWDGVKFTQASGPAEHILADPSGGVWLSSGSLLCRQSKPGLTNACNRLGDTPITGLAAGDSGAIWITTFAGLLWHDPRTGEFVTNRLGRAFESMPAHGIVRSRSGVYWVLFGDRDALPQHRAKLWLASFRQGQWLRKPNLDEPDLTMAAGTTLAIDSRDRVWITSESASALMWTGVRLERLRIPQPQCLYGDREANTWIGTANDGLYRLAPRVVRVVGTKEGLADEEVWTLITARDGSVWIGTDTAVTRYTEKGAVNFLTNTPAPGLNVRALAEEEDGTIWVGTMRGLHCIRNNQVAEANLPGEWFETKVRALLPARKGGVWVGTVRGLTFLQGKERIKYTTAEGLGSDEVRALLEEPSGDLWVGTLGGGLSHLHKGKFTRLTEASGLSSDNVWALHQDADGTVWAGTDNGLNRVKDGRVVVITVGHGLPANFINSICEDNFNRLWISHDQGVYWVRREELNAVADGRMTKVRAVQYDESDGMASIETNGQKSYPASCRTPDGRLWFPTTRGVAVFDPGKVTGDDQPPFAAVERIRANGEVVASNIPEEHDRLSSSGVSSIRRPILRPFQAPVLRIAPGKGRVITIEYTAASFVAPQKARFRYRLLGLHDSWTEAGTRRDTYFADLSPGEYTFEVMACSHHGVWPDRGTTVGLQLVPFFYQTWWFYACCGVALAGLAVLGANWRIREIRKIHELERANALSEQRRRIARDVHDDLGASLTQILQLATDNPKEGSAVESSGRSAHIAAIAEEAVDNIGEIVWANNPEFDTLPDLVAYIREYAAKFLDAAGIAVRFDFPDDVPSLEVNGLFRRHLLLVLKESLRNVTQHAKANEVRIQLIVSPEHLKLEIADDGCGLKAQERSRTGNGLANMRQRIAELNGSFTAASVAGHGTRIGVLVPWSMI